MTIRLSWSQPEDLLPHGFEAARLDGRDVAAIRDQWVQAGGELKPAMSGASASAASAELRSLARRLLAALDEVPAPADLAAREPEDLAGIRALSAAGTAEAGPTGGTRAGLQPVLVSDGEAPAAARRLDDRLHGAWLGRAAGCLLGKPVEKIPRPGIRAIAESTGNWPIGAYFTERGLDPEIARAYPWNRRSRPTSLLENIDGMPEDDDLNFPLIALGLLEDKGYDFGTDHVAQSWLANLPGGRVFTAERITYRNLLAGYEPDVAGEVRNPFREWIGAQIRTDVYGWALPGQPSRAAELAWRDGRLSHGRSGLYGAMFVAAAASAALTAESVEEVIAAGLSVVPPQSRYAQAIRRGIELGAGTLSDEEAIDAIYADYGHLHWVHVLNNSALLAFALTRSRGEFSTAITLVVSGGWDTDSNGATAGSICGALTGAKALPESWIDPLKDRLASSIPGFDGISFAELTRRTMAIAEGAGQ